MGYCDLEPCTFAGISGLFDAHTGIFEDIMDKFHAKTFGFDDVSFKLRCFPRERDTGTIVLIHEPETFGNFGETDPDFPVRFSRFSRYF